MSAPEHKAATRLALLRLLRPYLIGALGFSVVANLLMLVSPVYMLQIYDRVMTSGSHDVLIWLTVVAVFLLAIYGVAEAGRRRLVALAGAQLEETMAPWLFEAFEARPRSEQSLERNILRLNRIKGLFQSGGLLPFLDLPFVPLFIFALFLVHPVVGITGIIGALVVLAVAVAAEISTRSAGSMATSLEGGANELAFGLARQRSAIVAMGLKEAVFAKWWAIRRMSRDTALTAASGDSTFTAISRATRQGLQILILGISAALALSQEMSMGSIVASSILLARALGPIDQIVGGWRQLVQSRSAWNELYADTADHSVPQRWTPLPRPAADLVINRLAVQAPGAEKALIRPFSFKAGAGDFIVIMGANGTGKTSLLQTLAGAWPVAEGDVSLGGRDLHGWAAADRGRYIGYVPQDVEILPGTVKENIARFGSASDGEIFDAARAASAHELILALPKGYDTLIGTGGMHLSAGQKQVIGLARALFGNPPLLLLDEPTANLDTARAQIFLQAITAALGRGALVIAATHDVRCVQASSTVLVVRDGSVVAADTSRYLEAAQQAQQSGRTGT